MKRFPKFLSAFLIAYCAVSPGHVNVGIIEGESFKALSNVVLLEDLVNGTTSGATSGLDTESTANILLLEDIVTGGSIQDTSVQDTSIQDTSIQDTNIQDINDISGINSVLNEISYIDETIAENSNGTQVLVVEDSSTFYTNKGVFNNGVEILANENVQYLSRDGARSELITKDTLVTLPGKYFLATTNDQGSTNVVSFEIPSNLPDSWVINDESEIPEIVKQELFDYAREINITINSSYDDVYALTQRISNQIQDIFYEYPTIYQTTSWEVSVASSYNTEITITFPYDDLALIRKYNTQWTSFHEQLLNNIMNTSMDSYEREFAAFTYIIDNVTYDLTADMQHTLFGAAIDKLAVCDGYAYMFMYILNSVGIPTICVVGDAGEPHAWNQVQINGQTYHVDVTWADQDKDQIGTFLDYFNENDTYMKKTHKWTTSDYAVSTSDLYNLVNLDMGIEHLYNLDSIDELPEILTTVGNTKDFSLILSSKLNSTDVLNAIMSLLNQGLTYNEVQKTNQLVLNVKLD
ncbi:MAG: hypothetical protein ATN33_07835 [Epulopiscium sp. Nele67-Bin001]|nr:MAG: hypothetical protein ATN33_07835 [Epulopiscium sp. Nele67-Bin001]